MGKNPDLLACCLLLNNVLEHFWVCNFGFFGCLLSRNPGNRYSEIKIYPDASWKFVRMEFTENEKINLKNKMYRRSAEWSNTEIDSRGVGK